jgi:signal transduction histidine kinase/integral membrane sensor domain MASE1/CheY-like chemotaxis protein
LRNDVPDARSLVRRPAAWLAFGGYVVFGVLTLYPGWLGLDLELRRVIWLPSGIGLAAILRLGPRAWPVVALAEFSVTLLTGSSIPHAFGTALGNTVEVLLAWTLLRTAGMHADFRRWSDVAALVLLAAGPAAFVGAGVSALSLVAFEGTPWAALQRIWILWWLTHANGMILLTPFLLTMVSRQPRWTAARALEAVLLSAMILALGALVFLSETPDDLGRRLLYTPFPFLLWGAFRFGLLGASFANLLLSMVAILATAADRGPFVSPTPNASLFQLWIFVGVNAITALLVAGMVEERRRTARALARSEAHLRSVVESTADALMAVDRDGRVSLTNRSFAALWDPDDGVPPRGRLEFEDPKVTHLMEGTGDDVFPSLLATHHTLLDEIRLDDGRTLERYSAPLVRQGLVTGRIWSFRDLTERRRAEEERQRLEQQVQHAQKLESLGVLAGGIAHDFNNLLVAIMGNADLAAGALDPGHPAHDLVDEVIRASQRAGDLCQQMLAYAGKGRVAVGAVDLNEVVQEMGELLGVSISKGADLRLELEPGLPPVQADVVQLRQVVLNLLTNASDALARGRGEIRMCTYRTGPETFDPAASVLDGRPIGRVLVALEVADTGEGMDDATRARIFDPFFSTKAQGRGLGLAAVLGIVRGHRGTLELWSEPGKGTRMRILLPAMHHPAGVAARPEPGYGVPGPEAQPFGGTVLVVDDEASVREVAGRMLRRAGLEVVEAVDGLDAVARYRERPGGIDVVLLDLTMPRMGGAEAAVELRRVDPDVRIVLSTGYSDQAATAAGAGSLPLLRKPYRREELMARIRQALEES